ncbi:hypothetical protein AAHB60_08960 [Pseudomonas aeruginosa]
MHTQHIILAATTLAALLILIATAYLAGRKDRKNALQQAVGEELRHNVEAEATEKLADWQQRRRRATSGTEAPGDGAGDTHRDQSSAG